MFPGLFHHQSISSHSAHFTQSELRMLVLDAEIFWAFVFLLAGAVGQRVNYPDNVCAMKGSTVTLPCSFTTLESVKDKGKDVKIQIMRVVWCQNHEICQGSTPSVYDSQSNINKPRYRYLGDKKGNCTLQITDLQEEDDATLRFRVETNHLGATFTYPPGVKVTVTDGVQMKINGSEGDREFKPGERVRLDCTAECTFHHLEVTWFRDGHALPQSGPALQLDPLTAEDSGNYTCGVKNNDGTVSRPYSLSVEAEGAVNQTLMVSVLLGVLLAVFTLILVLCLIKRKRRTAAAAQQQPGKQKAPDQLYSAVLPPAEEDVSYASVQFRQQNQDRQVEQEDLTIYSSVVSG